MELLGLQQTNFTTPEGEGLLAFHDSITHPCGAIDLTLSVGEGTIKRTMTLPFIVIQCKNSFKGIIGRLFLAKLDVVAYTVHLKIAHHDEKGALATINAYLQEVKMIWRRISEDILTSTLKDCDRLDLNACKSEIRPTPDGEFEFVQLEYNLDRSIKMRFKLSLEVRSKLVECLQENADFLAISPYGMPGIDPQVACHRLNLDVGSKYVSQWRKKKYSKILEATEKIVRGLLDAAFISKAKYTEWLFHVILVKIASSKWIMCVDYTDLNLACPKGPTNVLNIDQLVDNSSVYQLISFTDAYFGYNWIPMYEHDRMKTAFMKKQANY